MSETAHRIIERCRQLAAISDVEGETTRLFLSPATRAAHALLQRWMTAAGLETRIDDAGSLRGLRSAATPDAPTLLLFSHIDTVRNAGAFDGPLGLILAVEIVAALATRRLPFHIEVIGFSEEEGVRFSFPFLSSIAATGGLNRSHLERTDADGITVADAVKNFGLAPERISHTAPLPAHAFAALEVHIEQGPALDTAGEPLAIVQGIAGQSRLRFDFEGHANHAGATPMPLRHDALAAAAQWITEVERHASAADSLVATVGRMEVLPGAVNVVPGRVSATLDVRHPDDEVRCDAVAHLVHYAHQAASQRGVLSRSELTSEQPTVHLNASLSRILQHAAHAAGFDPRTMFSGAGHDAMILAPHLPTAMLFVRSPGGISHHPREDVREDDVAAAFAVVLSFIDALATERIAAHPH